MATLDEGSIREILAELRMLREALTGDLNDPGVLERVRDHEKEMQKLIRDVQEARAYQVQTFVELRDLVQSCRAKVNAVDERVVLLEHPTTARPATGSFPILPLETTADIHLPGGASYKGPPWLLILLVCLAMTLAFLGGIGGSKMREFLSKSPPETTNVHHQ